MFEHLNTPEELFSYKLGSALKMEQELVDVLEGFESQTQRPEIKQALSQHREETLQHARNIEKCFELLGQEVDDSPCPVVEALATDAKATIKKTDDALVNVVILAAVAESEHYEIAVSPDALDRKVPTLAAPPRLWLSFSATAARKGRR